MFNQKFTSNFELDNCVLLCCKYCNRFHPFKIYYDKKELNFEYPEVTKKLIDYFKINKTSGNTKKAPHETISAFVE